MSFRRLARPDRAGTVRFSFEGDAVKAREGDTVATALLAAGFMQTRTSAVRHEGRAPYCLMGVCFECLMEIDGVTNRQACLVPVRDGMVVARQSPSQPQG